LETGLGGRDENVWEGILDRGDEIEGFAELIPVPDTLEGLLLRMFKGSRELNFELEADIEGTWNDPEGDLSRGAGVDL
jgi:hypothetical protein